MNLESGCQATMSRHGGVSRPSSELRDTLDAYLAAIIGSFMAMAIILGAGFFLHSVGAAPLWQTVLAGLFFGWCLVTELWFLATTWRVVLNKVYPYALSIALLQPRVPVLLRPLLGIWWGYQFLMALVWGK